MRNSALAATVLAFTSMFSFATPAGAAPSDRATPHPLQQQQQQTQAVRHVDLVIALDTSSSMDGLIDAARAKLWDVVNVIGRAQPQPQVRVGIISYGNEGYDSGSGWVRKIADLSGNLDSVYAKLFALRTNGGEEYVARAVQVATRDMNWDQDPRTLKLVFVAGNEPANQDPKVSLESALAAAGQRGIVVNSIYCGGAGAAEAAGWASVAKLGHGKYAAIDQNRRVAIATPMDGELMKLSQQLNETYVGYGAGGHAHAALQSSMDTAAASQGAPAAAARAVAKASAVYRNDEWDLVDARNKDKKAVAALPATALPAPMQAMSEKERSEYLDGKAADRAKVQKRIGELTQQRDEYLASERRKQAQGPATLDDALSGSIKEEAESAGFKF